MKGALIAFALVACSGKAEPPPVKPIAPPVAKQPPRKITAADFCDHFAQLKQSGCPTLQTIQMTRESCLAEMGREEQWSRDFIATFGACLVDHSECDEVTTCIQKAAEPKLKDLRTCDHHDVERAVGLPAADWAKRKGAGVTKFKDAQSTKAAPIEVCGVPAENEWLVNTACEDGSHPFSDNAQAEGARVGNVGEGGRCGAIIDQYKVKCPEATYEIFLDGYVCALPK